MYQLWVLGAVDNTYRSLTLTLSLTLTHMSPLHPSSDPPYPSSPIVP